MSRFDRQMLDDAIESLSEQFPKAIFPDPAKRVPLKEGIEADLQKDDVGLSPELLHRAIEFYQTHFTYQHALVAGTPRIDLSGQRAGTVTAAQQHEAGQYIRSRKADSTPRNGFVVEHISRRQASNGNGTPKNAFSSESPTQPADSLAPISEMLDALHGLSQPKLLAAGLKVVVAEIQTLIGSLEHAE
jgi:sRNA-binding protein